MPPGSGENFMANCDFRQVRRNTRRQAFRSQQQHTRQIRLIDEWGTASTQYMMGRIQTLPHQDILALLSLRARRFSSKLNTRLEAPPVIPATHISLPTTIPGIHSASSAFPTNFPPALETRLQEELQSMNISNEILRVHGTAPGTKREGTFRLVYENVNGLPLNFNSKKVLRAKEIHHQLEVDIAAYNEHRINLRHVKNQTGLSEVFRGGESDIRAITAHNRHENIGKIQEGGTCLLAFGQHIQNIDMASSGKDETGLGRWSYLTLKGTEGRTTRVVCGYNPCYNDRKNSSTSYQQQRRFFLMSQNSDICPRVKFREDLTRQLKLWQQAGDQLIVCLDANEHIYKKALGRTLTDPHGLNLIESVGTTTGQPIGATYFRGSKPIDGVWSSAGLQIVSACVMPVGYGIGDHRMFILDFASEPIFGPGTNKVIRPQARRLNTRLPGAVRAYNSRLEESYTTHQIIPRIENAYRESVDKEELERRINKIDTECTELMLNAEKKCRKIRSGVIPFSPEATVWIRRCQIYRTIIKRHEGKQCNIGNLRRAARIYNVENPLGISLQEAQQRLACCSDKCTHLRHTGHVDRRRHLLTCLSEAKEKEDHEREKAILAIISRERVRRFWRLSHYAMGRRQSGSVQVVQVEQEEGQIIEYRSQEEIENAIWKNIHQRRFFLAEAAPICSGPLQQEFGYNADSPAADEVLRGTYPLPPDADPATGELFQELANIRTAIPQDSVRNYITGEEWSTYWRKANEDTSSSVSGLHFGHHKASAHSELIAHAHAAKASIILRTGIHLRRWSRGLSVMLEKIPGCSLVTKLRSILLMEADFNCANKIIYGVRMLENVRAHNFMPEEIFSERNRTAEDGTLSKVLFYDIVRQSRKSAGVSSVDAENCYDRISHAIASLVCQAFGVSTNTIGAMLKSIQEMQFFLRTSFGDSKCSSGSTIDVKTQGLCQGNGAAPAGWAVISISILQAHKQKGHGATFQCPITQLNKTLSAVLYVDDTDLVHLDMTGNESVVEAHRKLQESVLSWGNLLIATGGALKPIKCFFHLISFKWKSDGTWSYDANEEREDLQIVVPLPDGSVAPIEHKPVSAMSKTLGSMTCPTGCSRGALDQMVQKAEDWAGKMATAKVSRRTFWTLLERQFWPKVGFGIATNTASLADLDSCLERTYWNLIAYGGVRRSVKRELRQLGLGFYGIGCPHPGVESLVAQSSKLLTHYGCRSAIGIQLQTSMELLILEIGLSANPFSLDFSRYGIWATPCWLKSLWEKFDKFGIRAEIGNISMDPPREGDGWLMQAVEQLGYPREHITRINRVRIHQQVLYISDILDASGKAIDKRYLCLRPENESWSTYHFPRQQPTLSDLGLWKNAVYAVAAHGSGRRRLGNSPFLNDGHKVWEWRFLEDSEELLRQTAEGIDVFTPSLVPGYVGRYNCYTRARIGQIRPLIGDICSVKETALAVYNIRSRAAPAPPIPEPTSFLDILSDWGCDWLWQDLRLAGGEHWILDAIRHGECIAVTDGSYMRKIHPELAAAAFLFEDTERTGCLVGSFSEQSIKANAYRAELMGLMAIHLILRSIHDLSPDLGGSIRIFSDCKGALDRVSNLPPFRIPSSCRHSDVLKNIMVNGSGFSFRKEYIHVPAHQDDSKNFADLDRPAQINCAMDYGAKKQIWDADVQALPPQRRFPLEPICCFAGRVKVSADAGEYLRFWAHRQLAMEVLINRKVLARGTFELVCWESVSAALHAVPRLFQIWANKQVTGTVATNASRAKWDVNISSICPSCALEHEMAAHILECRETGRVSALLANIDLLDAWLTEADTDPALREGMIRFAKGRGGISFEDCCYELETRYRLAARDQDQISWRRFMEGMIARRLVAIQQQYMLAHGSPRTITYWAKGTVIKLLEVVHGQWLYRNILVHDNIAGTLATARKEELLAALEEQQHLGSAGLLEEDQYLAEVHLEDLETCSGERQEYWLVAIRAARKAASLRAERLAMGIG